MFETIATHLNGVKRCLISAARVNLSPRESGGTAHLARDVMLTRLRENLVGMAKASPSKKGWEARLQGMALQ